MVSAEVGAGAQSRFAVVALLDGPGLSASLLRGGRALEAGEATEKVPGLGVLSRRQVRVILWLGKRGI